LGWRAALYASVSPLFEETVARGYLMTRLRQLGWSAPATIAFSVAVQTSYHAYQGLGGMAIQVPMFLVFALFFAWKRNIVPVALAHLLFQGFFLVELWQASC
jgi:membrane protease YdiL (CAAX protease family)